MTLQEELIQRLNIPSVSHEVIERMLARYLAVVEKELDWYFGPPREAIEILQARGVASLFLRQPPVPSTAVIVRDFYADRVVSPLDYIVFKRQLRHRWVWTGTFEVSYTEGFLEIPLDIQQLLLSMVTGDWKDGLKNFKSESIEDYSYTKDDSKILHDHPMWSKIKSSWQRGRI